MDQHFTFCCLPSAGDVFDRLGRHHRPDNPRQSAHDACFRAGGGQSIGGFFGEYAGVTGRAIGGIKKAYLAFPLGDCAGQQWNAELATDFIDLIAGFEIVAAIKD